MLKRSKLFALIVVSLVGYAHAEKDDRTKPMHIEANNAHLNQKTQISIFTGNVKVVQGTMQLLANKVTVREDAEGHQFCEGDGTPIQFKQKMDRSLDYLEAQASRFDYNGKTGILKLYDRARVKQGVDEVKGDVIIYDTHKETYEAQTQNVSRVHITITPKKKNTAAPDQQVEPRNTVDVDKKRPDVLTEHKDKST